MESSTTDENGQENKPSNRFQVQLVDAQNPTAGENLDAVDGVEDSHSPGTSQENPNGIGNGRFYLPDHSVFGNEAHETPRENKNILGVSNSKQRHVSIQSSVDEGEDPTGPEHDEYNTHESLRKFDTHNLRTFGRNTHEAIPRLDFYRNSHTTSAQYKRPTLEELHEEKNEDIIGSVEISRLIEEKDVERVQTVPTSSNKFGWVQGVLVRCLLSIWGVMLFMRLSWVVGQAGIGLGTLIVLLSCTVTTITALSMSAICTNGEVKGGGVYYMISRSLGPEFGGAIGVVFSLANAVAVAMHVIGSSETVRDLLKAHGLKIIDGVNDIRIIGVLTVTVLLIIALIGMEWEARAQLVLLAVLLISFINFFVGVFMPPTQEQRGKGKVGFYSNSTEFQKNWYPDFRDGESFMSIFSIFFPSATGIMAGANISGDLKDPSSAIPKGTLLAILLTGLSYLAVMWFLGIVVARDASGLVGWTCEGRCPFGLLNHYGVVEMVSGWGPIIIAGIFAATLSSALACLVSAPKIFQAVCKDKIFPYVGIFSKGYGPSDEPRLAYFLAYIISVGFILIGDLNVVAPLISNFFLMSYGLINYSCFDASLCNSPGWRPSFKFYSMYLSLLGAVLCVAMMFVIQWWAALITFAFVACLYVYVHYKKPDINWGSSIQAHVYKNTLASAIKLASTKEHVKNFRPQILVLSGAPHCRPALIDFANNICKGVSLLVCGHIILPSSMPASRKVLSRSKVVQAYELLNKRKVKGFYNYITSESLRSGCLSLMQTTGLGNFKPNTLLIGFKGDWQQSSSESISDYVNIIHDAFDAHYGVAILRASKGFDISNFITEEELAITSQPKQTKMRRKMSLVPASSAKDLTTLNDANDAEEEAEEEEEFEQDDIAITTLIGNKRMMRRNMPEINRFHIKQNKGTIDVWWLFDDGGLTLLIPHILSTKPFWQHCKLRVFLAGSKKGELSKEQKNMATLLSKLRIDYHSMEVIPTFGKPPSKASETMFENSIKSWRSTDDAIDVNNEMVVTEDNLMINKERTNRHLRTRDLVIEKSQSAVLIVLTLPVPRKGQPIPLYMSWIDCLSKDLPAPVLLLRGNQENVLTFYS